MPRRTLLQALLLTMLAANLSPAALAAPDRTQPEHAQTGRPGQPHAAGQGNANARQQALSPQEAAARARSLHGGKVLKVTPEGAGYRVRLLKDDGRVVTVLIEG